MLKRRVGGSEFSCLGSEMHRMGHSTMRAALIYQHATESRSRALADRLNDLVAAHREPASQDVDEGT